MTFSITLIYQRVIMKMIMKKTLSRKNRQSLIMQLVEASHRHLLTLDQVVLKQSYLKLSKRMKVIHHQRRKGEARARVSPMINPRG